MPVSFSGRTYCCLIVERVHCFDGFIVGTSSIVMPKSLLVLVHCWVSPLLMGLIVGVDFIVGPGLLLVLVNCWCGFIVPIHFWGRFHF